MSRQRIGILINKLVVVNSLLSHLYRKLFQLFCILRHMIHKIGEPKWQHIGISKPKCYSAR